MHPLLNIATKAARNASKIITRALDRLDTVHVSEKSQNDFVTEVDRLAEEEIITTLRKAHPTHKILAEESGVIEGPEDYEWIIDPLDGTVNFIHGIPHFCVSIAVRHKNKLEHGLIYDPIRDELFTASRGEGAQLNNRRIRVSNTSKLEHSLLATGFPFRNVKDIKPYLTLFEVLLSSTSGMRRAGSAALDLAYVAAGRFDGFWEMSLCPWDMAAGALLVREAGGLVGDFQGTDQFLESGRIIAGNPKIFKLLTQVIVENINK